MTVRVIPLAILVARIATTLAIITLMLTATTITLRAVGIALMAAVPETPIRPHNAATHAQGAYEYPQQCCNAYGMAAHHALRMT